MHLTGRFTVSLRTRVNGSTMMLDEAPMTINAGPRYRVRFEAIGTALRVYVNGRLRAQAQDASLPEERYGVTTLRSDAQFDCFTATRQ